MANLDLVDIEKRIDYVRKQTVFSQFTPEELETLATLLVEKHYDSEETIVTEGDFVDSVYFIVSGTADVRHVTVKDNALHTSSVATLKPNDTIGLNETGFYSLTGRRTATVVAITEMLLLRLSLTVFHGFALANSHVSQVLRDNTERMLKMRFGNSE